MAGTACAVASSQLIRNPRIQRVKRVIASARLTVFRDGRDRIRGREEEENVTTERTITEHEATQVERANASGATPVVFVHGLWLLPSSWARRVTLFAQAG